MLQFTAAGLVYDSVSRRDKQDEGEDEDEDDNEVEGKSEEGRRAALAKAAAGCWDWKHTGAQELPCYRESPIGEAARDLVGGLLQVHPGKRLFVNDVQRHPFFEGTSWDNVDAGLSPCPWPDFDKRLGFIDLVEDDESCAKGDEGPYGLGRLDDELTPEQQALFAGF
jgi:hypothetical protein